MIKKLFKYVLRLIKRPKPKPAVEPEPEHMVVGDINPYGPR